MKQPQVVVFCISDSLRYDNAYPELPEVMPYLSDRSVHFHQARSSACWTLPSHAGMFTGLWSHEHGATTHTRSVKLDYPLVAEYYRDAGYYTLMVTSNPVVTDIFGLNRGFDETRRIWKEVADRGGRLLYAVLGALWRPRFRDRMFESFVNFRMSSDIENLRIFFRAYAEQILETARKRVTELLSQGRKVFLFMNFYDTHFPYHARPRFHLDAIGLNKFYEMLQLQDIIGNDHMKRLDYMPYDNVIGTVKERQRRAFGRAGASFDQFARWLRQIVPDSTIVFGSDHGENFGEESWLYHFANVTEAGNRVPLLWSRPDQNGRADTAVPISLKDVFPSLLKEIGVRVDALAPAGAPSGTGPAVQPRASTAVIGGGAGEPWSIVEEPERSVNVIESFWYDAHGRTRKRFRRNQFAFLGEDKKYIYRDRRWHEQEFDEDPGPGQTYQLSASENAIEEASMPLDTRARLRDLFRAYIEFEKKVPKG